jgi:ankyrin repeat protein
VFEFITKSILGGSVVAVRHNGELVRFSRDDQLGFVVRLSRLESGLKFSDETTTKALERAKRLIHEGANINARIGYEEETPLFIAVHEESAQMVNFLLSQGADISIRDRVGRTALHTAAWYGRIEPLQLLLAAGADPKLTDDDGQTPLHLALLPDFSGLGPDLPKRQDAVRLLLEAGAKVTTPNKKGQTPLDLAKEVKDRTLVDLLKAASP